MNEYNKRRLSRRAVMSVTHAALPPLRTLQREARGRHRSPPSHRQDASHAVSCPHRPSHARVVLALRSCAMHVEPSHLHLGEVPRASGRAGLVCVGRCFGGKICSNTNCVFLCMMQCCPCQVQCAAPIAHARCSAALAATVSEPSVHLCCPTPC